MNLRTAFTLVIFVAFVGLCGYEMASHVKVSSERDMKSVRYVRSIEAPAQEEKQAEIYDLNKILETTDVNG